jgi:hypothetical protein
MKKIKHSTLVSAFTALGIIGCGAPGAELTDDSDAYELESASQALTCESDAVPAMTGLDSAEGTITRSGVYSSSYEATNAFDGKGSLWISAVNQTPAKLGYQFKTGPRTVSGYAIKFANGSLTSRAPKDWTLRGFNGSSWVVVDTRSNETNWAGVERRVYAVSSPGAYSAYELNITDDNDTRAGVVVASIDELELFDCSNEAGPHPIEWYTNLAGLPAPSLLGQEKEVPGCEVTAEQGAVTFNQGVTRECTYQPGPGWQIVSVEIDVLENKYNRGSYASHIIDAGGQVTLTEKELGDKWKIAIDTALSLGDIEAKTKLELEYQRHRELYFSVASNRNTLLLEATANGGAFRKSVVRLKSRVKLVRVL